MEAFVATFAMTDCSVQHSNALSSSAKRREMPHTHRTAAGWLQPWLLRFACRMAWSTKQLSRVRGGRPGRTLAPVRSKDGRMDFDVDQIPVPRRAGSSKAPLPFMYIRRCRKQLPKSGKPAGDFNNRSANGNRVQDSRIS